MDGETLKPWGRLATFGLGAFALLTCQFVGLAVVKWWYDYSIGQLANLGSDGVAVTLLIAISTPVEVLLLALFAQRTGEGTASYLGWIWPRRSHVIVGVIGVIAFVLLGDISSWLFGRDIVTGFQNDITLTANRDGWLIWLLLAVVIIAPISEETLFRGFLFRGWLKSPRDTWPVIGVTALIFAFMHVQYDWFVIVQIFVFGVFLGWMRWATGSTILTMLLHGMINFEGMLEALISIHH